MTQQFLGPASLDADSFFSTTVEQHRPTRELGNQDVHHAWPILAGQPTPPNAHPGGWLISHKNIHQLLHDFLGGGGTPRLGSRNPARLLPYPPFKLRVDPQKPRSLAKSDMSRFETWTQLDHFSLSEEESGPTFGGALVVTNGKMFPKPRGSP